MKKSAFLLFFAMLTLITQAIPFETQKRNIGAFTSIRNSTSIDIVVEQTGQYALEVQAPEKYFDNIITEIDGDQLHIYTRGNIYNADNMTIYIQVKDLSKILISGSGDFKTSGTLKSPELAIRVSGSGDIVASLNTKNLTVGLTGSGDARIDGVNENLEISQSGSGDFFGSKMNLFSTELRMSGSGDCRLSGSTDTFELTQSGSGDFSGRDFDVESAKIRKSSSGDARINVSKTLSISITGSGDLYYSGQPQFDRVTVTGSGDIVKIK